MSIIQSIIAITHNTYTENYRKLYTYIQKHTLLHIIAGERGVDLSKSLRGIWAHAHQKRQTNTRRYTPGIRRGLNNASCKKNKILEGTVEECKYNKE